MCSSDLGGALIYKQRGEGESTAISTAVSGAAGIGVDQPASTADNAEAVGGVPAEKMPEADVPAIDKQSPPPVFHSTLPTAVETKPEQSLSPEQEDRELSRAERISERRLRRRAERQARRESDGRPRKTSNDLLRIRDIFEGPARP